MKSSPYYPPRANTLSRFLTMLDRLVARLRMSQLLSAPVYRRATHPYTISWLLVPGLMWRGEAERAKLGNGIMLAWAIALIFHIVSLNTEVANFGAILASALHGISAAAVLAVIYPQWQGFTRVWKTSLYATLMVMAIYTIGLRNMMPSVAERITVNGENTMSHRGRWFSSKPWAQGEWVTYRFYNGMMNMDRILAGPGDTIRFHKDSFEVNGRFFQRVSAKMPVEGEKEMEVGTYYIWPTKANYNHAGDAEAGLLSGLSLVEAENIVGRPYQRWFWKSNTLESLKPIHNPKP